ncbi:MAG: threonine ammonia-lyase IlvA [Flavobacteriales bacterium]|nr:threonine ammonia-lyase IlvA [Flavobacteriales bacterium]
MSKMIDIQDILNADKQLKGVVLHTPLAKNDNLSAAYGSNVYLKREDVQHVRSYKLRGAYNLMSTATQEELDKGIVCASAGNHSQGVAWSCSRMGVKGKIYMPSTTPDQKVKQAKMFGKDMVEVILDGDTFDDAYAAAIKDAKESGKLFIHPFNDLKVIQGQGTVGVEILNDIQEEIDYLFVPIGGGGLASGVGSYFKKISPKTKIIGVEPLGAPAMKESLEQGKLVVLDKIDKFVDGAAVQSVGDITFEICKEVIDEMTLVPEGRICTNILKLYNEDAIVVEPAGALTISALEDYKEEIKGKNVVCIVSGSNNDITRMQEIKEKSLIYEGLMHYFILRFPQRAGALREFLDEVLGPNDDITRFEYMKKNERENGPAFIGVELTDSRDFEPLLARMKSHNMDYTYVNKDENLFGYFM